MTEYICNLAHLGGESCSHAVPHKQTGGCAAACRGCKHKNNGVPSTSCITVEEYKLSKNLVLYSEDDFK